MSKFWTIMSHTFMTRLKSKAFIITNIIMLILIIGLVNIQSIMDALGSKEKAEIIVLDTSDVRSEEHTSELQSRGHLVCRLLLEKKKQKQQHRRDWQKEKRERDRDERLSISCRAKQLRRNTQLHPIRRRHRITEPTSIQTTIHTK